jgi:hypothetical protein
LSFRSTLKSELWRPEERRLTIRRRVGWGWGINFAEVSRRLRRSS